MEENKTAIVVIVGRPSAGKSTFLNTACQEPVSIVSAIPQTTMDAIRGIVNTSFGQLVFVDTPGYHESEKKLNLKLRSVTENQLKGTDCILYILDCTRPPGDEEEQTAAIIAPYTAHVVAAINKIDLPGAKPDDVHAFLGKTLPGLPDSRILNISAKNDTGINDVLTALYDLAPTAPALYPENCYTDQEVGFRISEVIRGEAINRLKEEIPHCVYVDISDMEMREEGKLLWVRAFLCVERDSQKGIVIGKGAAMIKTIRLESLKKLRQIFDYKIDLDLQVKVDKNWRQKDTVLAKIIR